MKTRLLSIVVLFLLAITVCSRASAYSTPPNWIPMAMPGVSYNPVTNKLTAAPLAGGASPLRTNTAANGGVAPGVASFDPAAAWAVLNNTAFSRRAGWYDFNEGIAGLAILDQIRSVYGPDANLWIDCLSKSTGLDSYLAVGCLGVNSDCTQTVDYANPSGVPYSPIFGTPGSSSKWIWDGIMDHNTYAVPFSYLNAPNQPFSATYRIYIGDASGNELLVDKDDIPLGSAATTTDWQWIGPALVFAGQIGVAASAVVESDVYTVAGILAPGTSAISITGGEYSISTNNGATWGDWTAAPGTIANTNKVKVRQTSAAGHGVTTVATLAIPGVPGPGEFRVTTTTLPDPDWPVKIKDGFDQPTLAYAYSIVPDTVNHAVIMIKDGTLAESGFSAGRDIAVTLAGGYNTDFSSAVGATVIQGPSNILTVTQGKVIVDKLYIRSTAPL